MMMAMAMIVFPSSSYSVCLCLSLSALICLTRLTGVKNKFLSPSSPHPPLPSPTPFSLSDCVCVVVDKTRFDWQGYTTSHLSQMRILSKRKFVNEFLTGVVISFIFDRVIRVMETDIFSASPLRFLPVTADFRFCSAICLCPCMLI